MSIKSLEYFPIVTGVGSSDYSAIGLQSVGALGLIFLDIVAKEILWERQQMDLCTW